MQEPEAVLTVFHILSHKELTFLANQEADVLAQITENHAFLYENYAFFFENHAFFFIQSNNVVMLT